MSSSLKMCLRWPASCGSSCPRASTFAASSLPPRQMLPIRTAQPPFARALSSAILRRANPISASAHAPTTPATSSRFYAVATAASSSAGSATATAKTPLTWDTFFKLRLRRRRIQLAFSVSSSLVGGAAGAILLAEGFAEPLISQVPLDPFVSLGLLTFACAGMGWLIGPTIGNQVFYIVNRRFKTQMMQKESEFFTRVKKHRVDPSNSSAGNPVPDFYGEKIQSVAGYRRWLKDQRAFNKKKTASFV